MTMHTFNFSAVDPSWKDCLQKGLRDVEPTYLENLTHSNDWLPGPEKIFNAFTLPLNKVNYVLFGESPYPRRESANGLAFWDAAVKELWSATGLNKKVNRATSLRNIIKMLLVADNALKPNHSGQEQIAAVDKKKLVQTNDELFSNFLSHGFLLLNATPVLQLKDGSPQKDARAWYPFIKYILGYLQEHRPQVKFILLGHIANKIETLLEHFSVEKIYAEHPYNHSFITNSTVLDFFRPLHLLMSSRA